MLERPINDDQVMTLDNLSVWLKQEYKNEMVLDKMDEFQRGKLAGATALSLFLTRLIEDNLEVK